MADEILLLKASKDGDTAAFEQIVNKYQSLVCAITFSGTGRVDISEELAQETFLNAWKKLSQLKDLAGFQAWICAIARNMLNNYYRRKKTVSLESAGIAEVTDTAPQPSENLINQEEHTMLEQALMQIPAQYREPLVMYYRQQKSTRQVAIALNLNESTVRTRLHRAKQMLREQIAEGLEQTIEKTAPDKTFTKAVMLAVAGSAVGISASATAATTTAATTSITTILSTMTAKIITAAAVAVIAAGTLIYTQSNKPENSVQQANITGSRQRQQQIQTPTNIQTVKPKINKTTANLNDKTDIEKTNLQNNKNQTDPTIESDSNLNASENTEKPEYEFKPSGILSGLITDADTGQPVTDATISLINNRYNTTKTDENGFYSFQKIVGPSKFRIQVQSTEYVGIENYNKLPMINLKPDSQEVKHIKLDKACMVDLYVVDEEGNPLKKARIYTTSLADNRRSEIADSMYAKNTDDEGYILLGSFPPSESPYLITVTHSQSNTISDKDGKRLTESIPNYAPAGVKIVLNDPSNIVTSQVVLKKGISVKGFAEYLDGVPADGLSISAYPEWWHSNNCPKSWPIDKDGLFQFDQIEPGTYKLQISIPTGEGSAVGKNLFSTHLPLPEGELLKVTVPEKSPASLASISGTVTIIGDKIPNNIEVSAYSPQLSHQFIHLDFPGNKKQTTFTLDRLEPGSYRLQFSGSDIDPVTVENIQAPSDNIEVELIASGKPRLIGTVINSESEKPIENFTVRVKKLKPHRGPNYIPRNQWTDFRNKNGTFEIETVGPGLYQLQVSADGYAAQWSQQINTDNITDVLLKLNKGGTIKGMVKDSQGIPVPNASVIPLSLASGIYSRTNDVFVSTDGSTKTNNNGQFTLSYLAEGNETLKVTHTDFAYQIVQDIDVRKDQTTQAPPIVLDKGAAIEGYVYDAAGKPKPAVTLYVQDDSGYGGTNDELAGRLGVATTDDNGFYRVENLPEKMCYIRRQSEGAATGVIRRTVMPQNGKTSRIDFGGKGKLTGQVVIDDQPLANTRIQIAPGGNPHSGSFKAFAITDTNGNFSFYPGISGKYSLYYQITPSRDWKELAVATLKTNEDLELGIIPEQSSTLWVHVNQPVGALQWQVSNIIAARGLKSNAPLAAYASPPANQDEPYKIENLIPGLYSIILSRADNLRYKATVEMGNDKAEYDLDIDLPVATSSIHVTPVRDVQYLILLSEDETVQKTLQADNDGSYHADNIPPGRYNIFNESMIKKTALATFDLIAGQKKTIDNIQPAPADADMAILQVDIVDENGSPVIGCDIWLDGTSGTIEPTIQYRFKTIFMAPAGNYTIHTNQPGYKDISTPVLLETIDSETGTAPKPQKILLRLAPVNQ